MRAFRSLQEEAQRETRELGRYEARLKQAWSRLQEGHPEESRRLFASLPETTDSLAGLAEACRRDGDLRAAEDALRRATELDPGRIDLRLALDEVLLEKAAR